MICTCPQCNGEEPAEEEAPMKCPNCGEPLYYGDGYYHLFGVCDFCIDDLRKEVGDNFR